MDGGNPIGLDGGAPRRRKAGAAGKKKKKSTGPPKNPTIKDRIKAGARVHVGKLGGLYIVFDGKKHAIKC